MSDFDEALCWYKLFSAIGIGPKRLHKIHGVFSGTGKSVEQLCSMKFKEFKTVLPQFDRPFFDAIHACENDREREFENLLEQGIRQIHLGHQSYPRSLYERLQGKAPPLLFCRGNLALLDAESIAIVGSRYASEHALDLANTLAQEFARLGRNVISGYARGIDMQSHLGALQVGGTTTIVLSMGILGFSKRKEFKNLRWEGNVLSLSQFHPSERWRARNAMIRNRLICALSQAIIIIESGPEKDKRGKMSGTFNTGRTGIEMGVPIFVVDPTRLEKPNLGNQHLIDLGATMLTMRDGLSDAAEYVLRKISDQKNDPISQSGETEQMSLFP